MHLDNKMRKREGQGGRGWGGMEKKKGKVGKEGRMNQKWGGVGVKVKKTKRQTRKHSLAAHLEKMQVTNE